MEKIKKIRLKKNYGQLYSYTFSFRDEKININDLYSSKDTWQDTIKSKAQKDGIGDYTLFTEFNEEQSMLQNIFHISALLLATSHYEIP